MTISLYAGSTSFVYNVIGDGLIEFHLQLGIHKRAITATASTASDLLLQFHSSQFSAPHQSIPFHPFYWWWPSILLLQVGLLPGISRDTKSHWLKKVCSWESRYCFPSVFRICEGSLQQFYLFTGTWGFTLDRRGFILSLVCHRKLLFVTLSTVDENSPEILQQLREDCQPYSAQCLCPLNILLIVPLPVSLSWITHQKHCNFAGRDTSYPVNLVSHKGT